MEVWSQLGLSNEDIQSARCEEKGKDACVHRATSLPAPLVHLFRKWPAPRRALWSQRGSCDTVCSKVFTVPSGAAGLVTMSLAPSLQTDRANEEGCLFWGLNHL
eukprot:TRINITY_DN4096_c0_g2_i1.p1 TRINITY_DN4096_c0_g2~~TRINITY_DN4096_c0_g2_i1.p1  ORF type:complete len:104 (+),score=7.54 TRINITY_DN4096_c0_g2_i1:398-709(+)